MRACSLGADTNAARSSTHTHNHTIQHSKIAIKKQSREIERLNGVYVNLLKGAGVDYFEGR